MNDANDHPLGYSEQEARRFAAQDVKKTEHRVHGVCVEHFMPLTRARRESGAFRCWMGLFEAVVGLFCQRTKETTTWFPQLRYN